QAHFLERAEIPVVKANLDKLAATGLPIYISELDLNFADDARQANAMRDLFKVFWDHPSVAGVTHWGYRQGATWRTNAYLLRSDGTTRPAFDWINCYIAGGGDTCTVPEYVPQGWKGGEFGVTFEAEEYDAGQGIAALGSVVAYTDGGDWIAFRKVEFQQGWDKLWVTYAKGNTDPGNITIHVDSLDAAPALSVDLPPTAGWGSSKTLDFAWPSLSGTHDIYVRFNGAGGIANLDNFRIGKQQPDSGVNLVNDGGFETGIAGWNNWGNGTLSASNAQVHGGAQALRSTSRGGTGGFAAYGLAGKLQTGTTYAVSAWVLHTGAANDTVRLSRKLSCSGTDSYSWIQNNTAVAPNTWTQLGGNFVVPADCTVTDAAIYFEGTAAGSDVFIDDVKVVPPSSNLVNDGGFEGGSAGWGNWGNGTLSTTTTQFHGGAQSLQSTGRSGTGGFAAYTLGSAAAGKSYAVSAWVLVDGTTARLSRKLRCNGTDSYSWLQNNTAVVPNTWTQLSGTLTIPADCVLQEATIYFENVPAGVNAYLDDVSVMPL
ncbi:MAG TPA: carbohydrate binding domain-containing protein, partial [Povalibacter sp.]|nr:carbohydrate binding domain-containing protein [Povalibacter sp.]